MTGQLARQLKANMIYAFVTAWLFLPTLIAGAQAQLLSDKTLETMLARYVEDNDLPGGVLLLSTDNGTQIVATGFANLETGQAMEPHTRFYIASTGKVLVASAILRAIDEGRLQRETRIAPYLQDIAGIEELAGYQDVTIEQLLRHSSGLAEYLNDTFIAASDREPDRRWTAVDALPFAYNEPANPAGQAFAYTNTNYVILGHVLAQLYGSLAEAMDETLFAPLNLTSTSVGAQPSDTLAHGYDWQANDVSALGWNSIMGDGPIMTNAADLNHFVQALFANQTLLSSDMLAAMLSPTASQASYGLGLVLYTDQHGHWVGHGGAYAGFEADMRHYRDHHLTLIMMTNGNASGDDNLLETVADRYFYAQSR